MVKRERPLPTTAEPFLPKVVMTAALLLIGWLVENETQKSQEPNQAAESESAQQSETLHADGGSSNHPVNVTLDQ
jgi:hypothetical protein